jgi:hypothetical protein
VLQENYAYVVAGLSPRSFGLDPRQTLVGLLVDKLAVGQILVRDLQFGHIGIIPQCLNALAKLRKPTISFVMYIRVSVRLSVRMEQLGSHRTDFDRI